MLQKRQQFFTNFCFKLAIFNKKVKKRFLACNAFTKIIFAHSILPITQIQ